MVSLEEAHEFLRQGVGCICHIPLPITHAEFTFSQVVLVLDVDVVIPDAIILAQCPEEKTALLPRGGFF